MKSNGSGVFLCLFVTSQKAQKRPKNRKKVPVWASNGRQKSTKKGLDDSIQAKLFLSHGH